MSDLTFCHYLGNWRCTILSDIRLKENKKGKNHRPGLPAGAASRPSALPPALLLNPSADTEGRERGRPRARLPSGREPPGGLTRRDRAAFSSWQRDRQHRPRPTHPARLPALPRRLLRPRPALPRTPMCRAPAGHGGAEGTHRRQAEQATRSLENPRAKTGSLPEKRRGVGSSWCPRPGQLLQPGTRGFAARAPGR